MTGRVTGRVAGGATGRVTGRPSDSTAPSSMPGCSPFISADIIWRSDRKRHSDNRAPVLFYFFPLLSVFFFFPFPFFYLSSFLHLPWRQPTTPKFWLRSNLFLSLIEPFPILRQFLGRTSFCGWSWTVYDFACMHNKA